MFENRFENIFRRKEPRREREPRSAPRRREPPPPPPRPRDFGQEPYVVDIDAAALKNEAFRTALWTGKHLQLTLMSIAPGGDIGLEMHPATDQFLRVVQGKGLVLMGTLKDRLGFEQKVGEGDAILIPAGCWHNVINTGRRPMKLYSIYGPPQHPKGTVHRTKSEALAAEEGHR
ncbi:MAG TPA: cupin domain-containing protein [Candidatus Acidoferrum sp.]|nr:cupin domain-containing protein [Candidatus Acidoferrum sp.]